MLVRIARLKKVTLSCSLAECVMDGGCSGAVVRPSFHYVFAASEFESMSALLEESCWDAGDCRVHPLPPLGGGHTDGEAAAIPDDLHPHSCSDTPTRDPRSPTKREGELPSIWSQATTLASHITAADALQFHSIPSIDGRSSCIP